MHLYMHAAAARASIAASAAPAARPPARRRGGPAIAQSATQVRKSASAQVLAVQGITEIDITRSCWDLSVMCAAAAAETLVRPSASHTMTTALTAATWHAAGPATYT